jgi:acyl carrier protein phosphodiesterase
MNYLAHVYLSFNNPPIVVGNMISDFIKGKHQFDYPIAIQHGIKLHRAIDAFTDAHPIVKEAKQFFKPAVGAYSGAFLDIAFDHFLAIDNRYFNETSPLKTFSENTYAILNAYYTILPERFQHIFPYMQQNNWLENYQFKWGIEKSFHNIAKRATYLTPSNEAFQLFEEHYSPIQQHFYHFFPELKKFAAQFLQSQPNS